jgi:hypothetical protein
MRVKYWVIMSLLRVTFTAHGGSLLICIPFREIYLNSDILIICVLSRVHIFLFWCSILVK